MKLESVCKKCRISIKINKNMVLPVREYQNDVDDREGKLVLVYKCPFCGEIYHLSDEEKDKFSLLDLRYLLAKYSAVSEDTYRMWMLENDADNLIETIINKRSSFHEMDLEKLTLIREEIKELNEMIYLNKAINHTDKLYIDWFSEDELINKEKLERKLRRSLHKK